MCRRRLLLFVVAASNLTSPEMKRGFCQLVQAAKVASRQPAELLLPQMSPPQSFSLLIPRFALCHVELPLEKSFTVPQAGRWCSPCAYAERVQRLVAATGEAGAAQESDRPGDRLRCPGPSAGASDRGPRRTAAGELGQVTTRAGRPACLTSTVTPDQIITHSI